MNRKSEVSLSLSLLGRALWISGDAYLEEGVSLTWMCLHGEDVPPRGGSTDVMAVPAGEKRPVEEERQGQWSGLPGLRGEAENDDT
jgi:hypothetical protein